jgi:alpha-aminoadipic semialdehyde synthase
MGATIGSLRGTQVPVIFGLKEIPSKEFEAGKVYLFFAHVIKGQSYNMPMLRQIIDVGATLIDYERIIDVKTGRRLIFFGNWAGYAGMAETLRAFGQRLESEGIKPNPFSGLRPTYEYDGLKALEAAIKHVGKRIETEGFAPSLSPLVVGFIGYGNTSKGAQTIFDLLPYKEIAPDALSKLESNHHTLCKVVFHEEHTVRPRDSKATFDLQHYYETGKTGYESRFSQYLPHLSMLMNCIYWSEKYPRMITRTEISQLWQQTKGKPRLKVVGDISCDINGAIEFTMQSTKPDHPTFVYNPQTGNATLGIDGPGIVVMAVDNLPTELPREASTSFSETLHRFIPAIAKADYTVPFDLLDLPPEVKKAVIVYRGELTPEYQYLKEHLQGKA